MCNHALDPVIGMAGENLLRAVKLLSQHAAHNEMWPGGAPEGEDQIRAPPYIFRQSVGAADHEGYVADPGIPPVANPRRQVFAAKVAASLIQRCDYRAVRYRGQDRFAFPRLAAAGSEFPVVDFVNVQRPSYPALEMLEEIAFDAAAQAAYGDDMKAHAGIPSAMRRIHINGLGQSFGP